MINFKQLKEDNRQMMDTLELLREQLRQQNQQIDVLCGVEPEILRLEDHKEKKKSPVLRGSGCSLCLA